MPDCCGEILARLDALEALLGKPIDEELIINKSVQKSKQELNPGIALGIALGTGATASAGIATVLGNLAKSLAQKALALLGIIQPEIAALLAALAIVSYLKAMIDSIMGHLSQHDAQITQLFSADTNLNQKISLVAKIAVGAQQDAATANQRIAVLENYTKYLEGKVDKAKQDAAKAVQKSNIAILDANVAIDKSNAATKKADESIKKANLAIQKSDGATLKANEAIAKSNSATEKANYAIGEANLAKAETKKVSADLVAAKTNLNGKIEAANQEIKKANQIALDSQTTALIAEQVALEAQQVNSDQNRKIGALLGQIKSLQSANQSLAQENKKQQTEIDYLKGLLGLGDIDSKVNDAINKNPDVQAAKKFGLTVNPSTGLTAQMANLQKYLGTTITQSTGLNQQQAEQNKKLAAGITAAQAKAEQVAQQTSTQKIQQQLNDTLKNYVGSTTLTQTITQNQSDINNLKKVVSTTYTPSSVQTQNQIDSSINKKVIPLSNTLQDIKAKQQDQDKVNSYGIVLLKDLQKQISSTPVLAAAAIAPLIPTREQIKTAASAGVCETTKPGGCLGTPLNNIQSNQNNLANTLGAANVVGTGAELAIAQETNGIVKTIANVLGKDIMPSGLVGGFKRFVSWSGVDRIISLAGSLASIHNAFMLSTNLVDSFFEIADNLVNTKALIKNSEAEDIDTKEIASAKLDGFISKLIGKAEWESIKLQFKAYNAIYSSVSQAFGGIKEGIEEGINLTQTVNNRVGKLGNGMENEGLLGEDNWDTVDDDDRRPKSKWGRRLEAIKNGVEVAENVLEDLESVTGSLKSIVEQANEAKENIATVKAAVDEANAAAKKDREAKVEGLELPNFSLDDLF